MYHNNYIQITNQIISFLFKQVSFIRYKSDKLIISVISSSLEDAIDVARR